MDEKAGWIKLWRKFADDPLWVSEPFTKGQAWVDLLLMAQGTENTIFKNGRFLEFKPGTVYKSVLQLSKRWKWSRDKVSRFLACLENNSMVKTTSNTTDGTTITIENWAFYQSQSQRTRQRLPEKQDNKPTTGRHNKEGIRRNRRKEDNCGIAAPSEDGGLPAEGSGDDSIVIDGRLYRFPSRWRRDAEAMGKDLALFVKGMYQ